jgi:hypothetical protein
MDQNIIPVGRLLSGTLNGLNLNDPIQRAALDPAAYRQLRPYPAFQNVRFYQFTGTSSYHSLQATLSHQSGKNLQYFATYTFSKALGTVAVNESDGAAFADPVDTRGRSWGIPLRSHPHIQPVVQLQPAEAGTRSARQRSYAGDSGRLADVRNYDIPVWYADTFEVQWQSANNQ